MACGRGIHGPGISGAKGRDKRPGLDKVLRAVARREIDMVAAWSVDRIGRSLQDLLGFLGELRATGVDLYLHQQGLDTSTPAGKALFQMMGVFAEFERSIIQERVRAGLRRAKRASARLLLGLGLTSPRFSGLAALSKTQRPAGEHHRGA